jgi:hypothetical protein
VAVAWSIGAPVEQPLHGTGARGTGVQDRHVVEARVPRRRRRGAGALEGVQAYVMVVSPAARRTMSSPASRVSAVTVKPPASR